MLYDLIVVGGGPAGIFGAIYASQRGLKVAILEKKNRMGKKLLAAGAGKCNLTHSGEPKDFLNHFGDNGKFLKSSLYSYKPEDLKKFFSDNKLPLVLVEESGKYFPETFSSVDVVNLLYTVCKKNKVDIFENTRVEKLLSIEDDNFLIETSGEKFMAKNILLATGGKSYPATGSEGDGYPLAKKLGHLVLEPKPALTPIFVRDYPFTDLSGISFKNAGLELYRDNKKVGETRGDLLFTHKNFSGPLILDFSRYIHKGDQVKINYLGVKRSQLEETFLEKASLSGKQGIKRFLSELGAPERFIKKFLKLLNISDDKKLSEISKKERNSILTGLCEMPFEVSKLGDYSIAMVTTGGISLKEINPKTMESKIVKGLYFAGEVVDIDGDTGGFNIQAACSMGVLAAKSIKL
ncbi:FAD-dependent oxidoreductase [Propionigenium maris DSM 9537]|uniref:FAD-dependent oxidoreductase n=1 Tax=Propionigenium maris DSM 9537 TaxID=1123000 RepID=A0A9W6GPI6_9FUSO|nr:NAD(P)/FAD-dependent oxidoreductase [Propionigenium maris]GLI58015.1 FAD-dependent oxidoreductase [Propionigenium maris DSM 9537]